MTDLIVPVSPDGEDVRPMKDLAGQINEANKQRIRELSDLIVNRLPMLPEELDELRDLINSMSEDEAKQRATCMDRFKDLEILFNDKVAELKLAQVREIDALRSCVNTTNALDSANSEAVKALVLMNDEKYGKAHYRIYIAITLSFVFSGLSLISTTPYFKPAVSFLLSIVKLVF